MSLRYGSRATEARPNSITPSLCIASITKRFCYFNHMTLFAFYNNWNPLDSYKIWFS